MEELILKPPFIWKDWGVFLFVLSVGMCVGLISLAMAYDSIYMPWTTTNSIVRAISANDMSYIATNVKDRDFIRILSRMNKEYLQRIKNDKVIDALFEAARKLDTRERATDIIGAIGGPDEAAKLVDLLFSDGADGGDYRTKLIIEALEQIGDSRAKVAVLAVLGRNNSPSTLEDALETLGDLRPIIDDVCSMAITGSLKNMYVDNKEMFKKENPWRYMTEYNGLIPPTDTTINIFSSLSSVSCVKAHYEKMFTYGTGFPSTSALSGDAVKITWEISVVDIDTRGITATTRVVGENPPTTISVNKFTRPFGEHGYGIPPVNAYEQWVKLLPTKE